MGELITNNCKKSYMWKKFQFSKGLRLYQNEIIPMTWTTSGGRGGNKRQIELEYHNPLHYFRIYLNFGYFFHYLPFRLKRVKGTKFYMIKTSRLHKVGISRYVSDFYM